MLTDAIRYKAKYAENTLAAFEGAVEAGVDMIETGEYGVIMIDRLVSNTNGNRCPGDK